MKLCQKQNLIVDYYFDELNAEDREKFGQHLSECPVCTSALQLLADTAPLIKKFKRELPDKKLLKNYQQNLRAQFSKQTNSKVTMLRLFHQLLFQPSIPLRLAEATALIVFGIFLGRLTFFQAPVTTDKAVGENTEFVQASQGLLTNYLQETEMILLDVYNLNPVEDENLLINLQQITTINNLLQKTILCRQRALELNDEEIVTLINEIEPILLEMCNLEKETAVQSLYEIKEQIENSHLLFELKTINPEKI